MNHVTIAIIGGSGLYKMDGLSDIEEISISTPFGAPSDAVIVGTLEGQRVAFLPRHGRGHRISPTGLNSRANIYALKSLGARYIISVSACGSLREDLAPGHIVIPDQLVDRTRLRPLSFFGEGLVAHLSAADPLACLSPNCFTKRCRKPARVRLIWEELLWSSKGRALAPKPKVKFSGNGAATSLE